MNYMEETIKNLNKQLEALLEIDTILSLIDVNDNPTIHYNAIYKEMKYITDYHSINLKNTKKILKSVIEDYESILRNN
jgi:hypothetical protein